MPNWFEHLWPMTTILMTTHAVTTTPRPWIDPGFDIPNLNYRCFDMQHTHSWWQNDLDTYDHPKNDHPGGHDHSQTFISPGFDIPDLNYPQLDTRNVKIGPREGAIRFWTKIVFLDHCAFVRVLRLQVEVIFVSCLSFSVCLSLYISLFLSSAAVKGVKGFHLDKEIHKKCCVIKFPKICKKVFYNR